MPSLRKRVSTYFRQLSFHQEPRQKRHNINENAFITKYLLGHTGLREGPTVLHGKNPLDLPNFELAKYEKGGNSVIGCYSGPDGGLTAVKRTEKHLSMLDADIDFIDTLDETAPIALKPKKSPLRLEGQPLDNTKMIIKVAGQEYCVKNQTKKRHSKSLSLGSMADFNIEIEKTKIDKEFYTENNNSIKIECKNTSKIENRVENSIIKSSNNENSKNTNNISSNNNKNVRKNSGNNRTIRESRERNTRTAPLKENPNRSLSKSKSDGNPFNHKKTGKHIVISARPNCSNETDSTETADHFKIDDTKLPNEWNKKSDLIYGIANSLYDVNQVSKRNNGDPIADCFGIIARKDSAILAVADGVNWGERASIAAKSAVHGCLHYLNKTIFNDTKPFENLTIKPDGTSGNQPEASPSLITNTKEVFVCLLRAFNCAHDLILENKGMLTTLTVAVVLPIKSNRKQSETGSASGQTSQRTSCETNNEQQYICCVCNVGDTLAYVYSQKGGVRELTKGSHDITSNRDMRDALGALGPVDGINPELSNLTLSVTKISKGDIVFLATDGLTDNFDPNVCKFTVTSPVEPETTKNKPITKNIPVNSQKITTEVVKKPETLPSASGVIVTPNKAPVKPPRRSHINRDSNTSSIKSNVSQTSSHNLKSVETTPNKDIPTTQLEDDFNNPLIQAFLRQNSHDACATTQSNALNKSTNVENVSASKVGLETPPFKNNTLPSDRSMNFDKSATLEAKSAPPKGARASTSATETRTSLLRRQLSFSSHKSKSNGQGAEKRPVSIISSQKAPLATTSDVTKNKNVSIGSGYKFLRSKTMLDVPSPKKKSILRNEDGLPFVTPLQRYELQLLLMEDVLKNGISGRESPCTVSKQLCENLVNFTFSITSAKRHTLEDSDLYYDNQNGVLVEVSRQEKRIRRRKGLDRVENLPGKLDHVTIVAYNVGNFAYCSK